VRKHKLKLILELYRLTTARKMHYLKYVHMGHTLATIHDIRVGISVHHR